MFGQGHIKKSFLLFLNKIRTIVIVRFYSCIKNMSETLVADYEYKSEEKAKVKELLQLEDAVKIKASLREHKSYIMKEISHANNEILKAPQERVKLFDAAKKLLNKDPGTNWSKALNAYFKRMWFRNVQDREEERINSIDSWVFVAMAQALIVDCCDKMEILTDGVIAWKNSHPVDGDFGPNTLLAMKEVFVANENKLWTDFHGLLNDGKIWKDQTTVKTSLIDVICEINTNEKDKNNNSKTDEENEENNTETKTNKETASTTIATQIEAWTTKGNKQKIMKTEIAIINKMPILSIYNIVGKDENEKKANAQEILDIIAWWNISDTNPQKDKVQQIKQACISAWAIEKT